VGLAGGGHVLHVAAVDERYLLGALADRSPGAVHCREAAADDDYAAAGVARVRQAEGGDLEVFQAVDDADRVLIWNAELVRDVAAGGDDRGVETPLAQVVEAEVAPEFLVDLELGAEPPDGLVLGIEDIGLGQAVLRDAVAQHSARGGVALEDGGVVAGELQVVGRGHSGRPGADDGHALAGLGLRLERQRRFDAVLLGRQDDVAGIAVAVADGDRLVDLVAAAVLLARRRADSAQDRGERDRPLEDSRRLAELALGIGLEEARDVDVARALVLAGRQAVGVVVAEDQLEVSAPKPADLVGLGPDNHPRDCFAAARNGRMIVAVYLHDAHAARPEARQLGLVAERRDLDAVGAADLQDRLALGAGKLAAVDLELDGGRRNRALRRLRGDQALGGRIVDGRDRVSGRFRVRAAVDPSGLGVPDRLLVCRGPQGFHGRGRGQDRQRAAGDRGRGRRGLPCGKGRFACRLGRRGGTLAGAKVDFSHGTPQETDPAGEAASDWQIPAGHVLWTT